MSVSGDLNAKAFGAQKASDHFGTDDESLIWIEISWIKHVVLKLPVPYERDEATEKQNKTTIND